MSSALDRVLARLPNARRVGGGYIAHCPAHEDRSPSLSIREGREGVLLNCFAGCAASAIVAALGLRLADLFDKPLKQQALTPKPQRRPTANEVETALHAHLKHILNEEVKRLGYAVPITSRHHNAARRTVSRLFGIVVRFRPPAWWEHAQYDNDPLWATLAQRAFLEIVAEREHADPTREDYLDAEERAAAWMRYEARRETQQPLERAA